MQSHRQKCRVNQHKSRILLHFPTLVLSRSGYKGSEQMFTSQLISTPSALYYTVFSLIHIIKERCFFVNRKIDYKPAEICVGRFVFFLLMLGIFKYVQSLQIHSKGPMMKNWSHSLLRKS